MKSEVKRILLILMAVFILLGGFTGCDIYEEQETAEVIGRVEDAETGEPLAGSLVKIGESREVTGEEGNFEISDLKAGKDYKITITNPYIGDEKIYENYEEEYSINDGGPVVLENIELSKRDYVYSDFNENYKEEFNSSDYGEDYSGIDFWQEYIGSSDGESEQDTYSVTVERRVGSGLFSGDFDVYYPENMRDKEYPVITWGNGTGASPTTYSGLLREMASHGFIVIASRSRNTGTGEEMIEGVEWLIEENEEQGSEFYGKIDEDNIGATGHSQGGGGALNAGTENIIKTTVLIQPALLRGGNPRDLTGPTFVIAGGRDMIVWESYIERSIYNRVNVPAIYGVEQSSGHFAPVGSARGMSEYIIDWFKAHLQDDVQAQKTFDMGDGIFDDRDWDVSYNNIDEIF